MNAFTVLDYSTLYVVNLDARVKANLKGLQAEN